ncbi:MAG: hypothetical protein KDA89_24915 [Planctomycetaceae bacterium]|nr:hypothetical protein [Planctomycetaceae bacterium]
MAKRGASGDKFVMSQEIRALLEVDKNLTGRQVLDQLKAKFPKHKFNENSCQAAYSNVRISMGISKVRRKRPGNRIGKGRPQIGTRTVAPASSAPAGAAAVEGFDLLIKAKELLRACNGDAQLAATAIRQLSSLQVTGGT